MPVEVEGFYLKKFSSGQFEVEVSKMYLGDLREACSRRPTEWFMSYSAARLAAERANRTGKVA
jgi:hypothetical protein